MKTKYLLLILTGLICWTGCNDDNERLTPSDEPKYELKIPQGNHDYDNRIVEWFDRTGVFILYKFKARDIYFNVDNEWLESYQDTSINYVIYSLGEQAYVERDTLFLKFGSNISARFPLGITYDENGLYRKVTVDDKHAIIESQRLNAGGSFKVEEALDEYAGKQLAWIEEMFLNFYPDALLKSDMLLKLILGRNLKVRNNPTAAHYHAFNSLIIGYGDETLETLTATQKNTIKQNLHSWFIKNQLINKVSFDEFSEVTNYYWVQDPSQPRPGSDLYYSLGLLTLPYSTNLNELKTTDLNNFLNMILGNSYEKLTREPENGNYNASDFTGVLHPKKDVNGLIRKKYDLIVNELARLGLDLKAVGELYN